MTTFYNNHRFLLLALLLIWVKTTIVTTFTFQLTSIQIVLFLLNTLLFLIIIFGFGLFIKPQFQVKYYFLISLILSVILYSNVVYYREFTDIITLPMLSMSSNMGDLSTSIFALIAWYDIFYFIDVVVIGFLMVKKIYLPTAKRLTFHHSKAYVLTALVLTVLSLSYVNLLERTNAYNREQIVNTLGIYSFYLYDAFIHTQTNAQPVFSNEDDLSGVLKHLEANRIEPNEEMFGIAKDMNVIVVSLESVESFVIGETLNGEEITPFLNEFIEESFYFENFYYQTGQGKTSDAEFLINNSLYPLGRGAVFLTHHDNQYKALPKTLSNQGYYSAVFHANDKTFYNRDVMYPNLGYDGYYSFKDYEISRLNSVGWGLKDIDFVKQSMDYLTTLPEPFYSTVITLTNHFPYHLDEQDHLIEPFESNSRIVNQYFPTVRYTDEAMRILVDQLKEEDLYENTILVMYGDHYGIANSHYGELSKFLDKEITAVEAVKLERVPLIVHIPGLEGETFETVSGQIDVMPTLLNLLGIKEDGHTMFGNDLFAEERDDFAILRNGTVITDEFIYTNETCLSYETGEEVAIDLCQPLIERGAAELYFSDKIIYRDLFRFKENVFES